MNRYKQIYSYYLKNTAYLNEPLFDELLESDIYRLVTRFKSEPESEINYFSGEIFKSLSESYFQKYIWTVFHKQEINNQYLSIYTSGTSMNLFAIISSAMVMNHFIWIRLVLGFKL
ncbi:Uncharacterised protein [Budvicia aquatica]|uniref:Uncharacterized protein n=1 Tax=Budvicia aquatica TaxID=82979 RepID=A0A484ZVC0_9GAMM|nr:Uncharacterised protein [Budvicia aquatica]